MFKKLMAGIALLIMGPIGVMAQQVTLSKPHGFCDAPFTLTMAIEAGKYAEGWDIRYTLDSSTPTAASPAYTKPISIHGSTIVRAAAFDGEGQMTDITTATYLFVDDVMNQSDTPEGYPTEWGQYIQMGGIAPADYGMDAEMTKDAMLAPKIREGLQSLPVLSIVTDKENLFSHENDEETGGIYIFTGPPVGDATGHGWTRPASIELMGGEQAHNLSATCGLRLHGGHGRLAEKNPKHSFRLVFKSNYGLKKLEYPLFGADEPDEFNQLVLRCHFGNAWQHWLESNRQKAQYTRDVWARRMQKKMGQTSVNALYVNLFINGMYWGLYNIAERVDDQFGKDHLGGKKSDIDVIKVEEDGGIHLEAAEGDMEAWNLMVETAARAADDDAYEQLDSLLDIDSFIDYMLINQYAGNTDWDYHNWYAIRRRGLDSEGFRFLCWDTELIFDNVDENVLSKDNGDAYPTGIFHHLMENEQFVRQYLRRAKQVLADDGFLGETSVVAVWDSLYHNIETALYAEAARWGDYRRDVHPYSTRGTLYTVDNQYLKERDRLLTQYFPYRSEKVLQSIVRLADIDDFEAPDGWERLTASMFHEWDGTDADAQPLDKQVKVDWNMNKEAQGGTAIAGFSNVDHNQYADISQYEKLVIRGSGSEIRILANRLVAHGEWKQITVSLNSNDPYWDDEIEAIVLPLEDLRTTRTSNGNVRDDDFLHLHVLKVDWNKTANVRSVYLVPSEETLAVTRPSTTPVYDDQYYNLQGQPVEHPTHGIYIYHGRKVMIKP